jgi:hypothetical protein
MRSYTTKQDKQKILDNIKQEALITEAEETLMFHASKECLECFLAILKRNFDKEAEE